MDAHVGRQTREHGDLDVFLDDSAVPAMLDWLLSRGYRTIVDWLPVRVELASPHGRVDLHPMVIGSDGDGVQQSLDGEPIHHSAADRTEVALEGRSVSVATVKRLRDLRRGYDLRPVDAHDVALLEALVSPVPGDAQVASESHGVGRSGS